MKYDKYIFKEVFNIDIIHYILIALVVVSAVVAFVAGIGYRKSVAEKQIGSAEQQATTIINDAIKNAENKKREILLEAKEESQNLKAEIDKEIKERS